MPHKPNPIDYITNNIEVVLPDRIDKASKILARMLLEEMGQLQFDLGKDNIKKD